LLSAGYLDGFWRTVIIYVTFAYFGFAMSGISVIWQLSSIRFAENEDAGVYHSVHVAATGIRGLIAPLLGLAAMTVFSKTTALFISSGLFIIASLSMGFMRWWDYRTGRARSLRAVESQTTDK